MNPNGRSMSLHRLATQITLCNGGVNVWYLPYDPYIQGVIIRQLRAARPGGQEEYEPLQREIIMLRQKKETKDNLAEIAELVRRVNEIRAIYGNELIGSFAILDSCIVDVELLNESNTDALAVDYYWQNRNGNDPVGNYDMFAQYLSDDTIDELWQGYQDTRTKLPAAPKETQEEAPPPDNPLEPSGSQAKKGKRGKKPTPQSS